MNAITNTKSNRLRRNTAATLLVAAGAAAFGGLIVSVGYWSDLDR